MPDDVKVVFVKEGAVQKNVYVLGHMELSVVAHDVFIPNRYTEDRDVADRWLAMGVTSTGTPEVRLARKWVDEDGNVYDSNPMTIKGKLR